jgi:aminoglycoside N3'-acetyltransferase
MTIKIITRQSIKEDLISMGIQSGDTILVRADLGKILKKPGEKPHKESLMKKTDYLDGILDAVGKTGTVVGLSFTSSNFIKKRKDQIFKNTTPSNTGSFTNLMLQHPNSKRSLHPTNSYVAIGKHADYIVANHNETSEAYAPVRKIMGLKGKLLLIGCLSESPGFTTTHLAECDLNYHKKIIWPTLNTCYYEKNNQTQLFKRKDLGSCSTTFGKFYEFYMREEKLIQSYIGNAYTIMIDAQEAYNIDYKVLKENPKITICNNKDCFMCRARRWDNLKDLPQFLFRKLSKILKK